ncbi:MAG: class I SAM-dependent methyltransferase [Rhodospirillales bacterium]|nr:class I SAM-dependent methyltransferase [Rhodospirillales bacterium]
MVTALKRLALLPGRRGLGGEALVNAVLRALDAPEASSADIGKLRAEIVNDAELAAQYERNVPRLLEISPHKQIRSWGERMARPIAMAGADIFYVLPRILRPALVVETGVASGSMTAMLLAALHRNGFGALESFDLPAVAGQRSMDWSVKNEDEIGFLVPAAYRDRWKLTLGDATYLLPRAMEGRTVDCFFHDSDHSYEHQIFEYALALKHLSPRGWIVSDDVSMSPAFERVFSDTSTFFHRDHPNVGIAVPNWSQGE